MSDYRYAYVGGDEDGRTIWSCVRVGGSGIAGYGRTQKEALQAFLDLEQELLPPTSEELESQINEALLNDNH